jgi:hypothetical protein
MDDLNGQLNRRKEEMVSDQTTFQQDKSFRGVAVTNICRSLSPGKARSASQRSPQIMHYLANTSKT